ncbi:MAG: ROK family protein [Planctomycetes bacterium]|nr:ROK family protein [Planctomycetota bacterium]
MSGKKPLFAGLDLGGNHVKVGIGAGETSELVWDAVLPSGVADGREGILRALVVAAESAACAVESRGAVLAGIALGSPGVVDRRTGRIRYEVANLPDFKGVDLGGTLRGAVGVPAVVDNDANVAALAEALFGAGRGHDTVVMATVGTGIGGGAVIDGRLVRGDNGAGMELGHIPFDERGPLCGCGRRGCLEAHVGGRALRREWIERLGSDAREGDALTLRDLIDAASSGDATALAVLDDGADRLGVGLTAALHLLNPSALIIGGGVVDGFPRFFDRTEASLRARALDKALDGLVVRRAEFGNRAGVIGAIALAARESAPNGASR